MIHWHALKPDEPDAARRTTTRNLMHLSTDNNRPRPRNGRHTAVVGMQWGDEGKGKIVDLLTSRHDVIVSYNGNTRCT